jgi:hypothetical protein
MARMIDNGDNTSSKLLRSLLLLPDQGMRLMIENWFSGHFLFGQIAKFGYFPKKTKSNVAS